MTESSPPAVHPHEELDLLSLSFNENFDEITVDMLVQCPAAKTPDGWLLTRHEDVAATERIYVNLRYCSETPQGGHFSAFEQPEQFVDELRKCFRLFREEP